MKKIKYITTDEWDKCEDDIHQYLSIKIMIESGAKVALKDKMGNVYGHLKIEDFNKTRYICLDRIN